MASQALSVLLVDDDPAMRDMFQMVMDHHHVELITIEDAETALTYLAQNQPNVIVLDLFLPGLDGYQMLRQMRKKSLAPDARVIATTAYYTADTEQETLSRGFDGYLPKPIDANGIVPYLESLIQD